MKNPPASAGNTGLIPGPGRPHMLWGNEACGQPGPRPRSAATEAAAAGGPGRGQRAPPAPAAGEGPGQQGRRSTGKNK